MWKQAWMRRGVVWLAAAVLITPASAREIRGRIVDAEGKPAAAAAVFRGWSFPDPHSDEKDAHPTPWGVDDLHHPLITDERGEFAGAMADVPLLFAIDAGAHAGALVQVDLAQPDAQLEVELEPLVEVRGRFAVRTPGEPPRKTAIWIGPETPTSGFLAVCISESREFRVLLPPGEYWLSYSTDAANLYRMHRLRQEPLVVQAGQGSLDLGSFQLDLPFVVHPHGVVLDRQGAPVSATLGESWGVHAGYMQPWSGFETETDGRFRGSVEVHDLERDLALLAFDRKREHGALAFWNPKEVEKPLELRLEPAIRVHGSYVIAQGGTPSWTNTYVYVQRATQREGELASRQFRIAECQAQDGRFEFRLPPGQYRLEGYGTSTTDVEIDLELASDRLDVDLGVIELPQTIIARNVGKEALPWHVTDARGLSKDVELSDFRGKWVLLEFWGWW